MWQVVLERGGRGMRDLIEIHHLHAWKFQRKKVDENKLKNSSVGTFGGGVVTGKLIQEMRKSPVTSNTTNIVS